jgi:hypothetical protein
MRVGVYVDAYNLYYAGRKLCGRGTPGWRWLDIRALATALVAEQSALWPSAYVERVVYCTARVRSSANPTSAADQDTYLRALALSQSVDYIEFGTYISKIMRRPLALEGTSRRPVLVKPAWPITVHHQGIVSPDANFFASVATWEEKGSDVNVASHLLVDVLDGAVDAAVVVSNDSDLRWPVQEVRRRLPLGMVNPGSGYTAGSLSADRAAGLGGHWWRTLTPADFRGSQLANPVGKYRRPVGW